MTSRHSRLAAGLAIALSLAGSPAAFADDGDACRPISNARAEKLQGRPAVVTDTDGTLGQYVLLDFEATNSAFLDQGIAYPRTDAALMMNIYHRRGYLIVYMAGRPRQRDVLGKSMCDASVGWLEDNGFPVEENDTLVLLRDGPHYTVNTDDPGAAMSKWMGEDGTKLFESLVGTAKDRFDIKPVYGYADSGAVADAFITVGVPADHIWTIGNKGVPTLGYKGTHPIMGPESNPGFSDHVRDYVIPTVPALN